MKLVMTAEEARLKTDQISENDTNAATELVAINLAIENAIKTSHTYMIKLDYGMCDANVEVLRKNGYRVARRVSNVLGGADALICWSGVDTSTVSDKQLFDYYDNHKDSISLDAWIITNKLRNTPIKYGPEVKIFELDDEVRIEKDNEVKSPNESNDEDKITKFAQDLYNIPAIEAYMKMPADVRSKIDVEIDMKSNDGTIKTISLSDMLRASSEKKN